MEQPAPGFHIKHPILEFLSWKKNKNMEVIEVSSETEIGLTKQLFIDMIIISGLLIINCGTRFPG